MLKYLSLLIILFTLGCATPDRWLAHVENDRLVFAAKMSGPNCTAIRIDGTYELMGTVSKTLIDSLVKIGYLNVTLDSLIQVPMSPKMGGFVLVDSLMVVFDSSGTIAVIAGLPIPIVVTDIKKE
jgi:hypothetical protein